MSKGCANNPILITPKLVELVRQSLASGTSQNMTAKKLGVSASTVHRIRVKHIEKVSK